MKDVVHGFGMRGAIVRRRRRKSRSSCWRFATGEGPALARTQPALQFAQELNNPTGERNKPLILGGVVKGFHVFTDYTSAVGLDVSKPPLKEPTRRLHTMSESITAFSSAWLGIGGMTLSGMTNGKNRTVVPLGSSKGLCKNPTGCRYLRLQAALV